MRLMHTVEAAPALGGQSQVPSTPGSVLASCDRVEKYEIDRAHAITIKAIAVFSFQERNMIAPYCERGSAAFDGRQQAAHACLLDAARILMPAKFLHARPNRCNSY